MSIVMMVRLVFHGLAADVAPAHGDGTLARPVRLRAQSCLPGELALLPGIGIAQARALAAELRRGGTMGDLLAIPGVGEVRLARLLEHVDLLLEAGGASADDRLDGSRAGTATDRDDDAPAAGRDPQGDRHGARGGPGRAR
jgi:hypothetical protein